MPSLIRPRQQLEQQLRPKLTFPGLPAPRYAIVIPVVCTSLGVQLLIEVRASGISQSGDPCFPGGHIEAGETPEQAAVRELWEELGIRIPQERILGQLPTVQTMLGVRTDVCVCVLEEAEASKPAPNPDEVAVLLRPPLERFLSEPYCSSWLVSGHEVWGMTAGAIHRLLEVWPEHCAPGAAPSHRTYGTAE